MEEYQAESNGYQLRMKTVDWLSGETGFNAEDAEASFVFLVQLVVTLASPSRNKQKWIPSKTTHFMCLLKDYLFFFFLSFFFFFEGVVVLSGQMKLAGCLAAIMQSVQVPNQIFGGIPLGVSLF